MPDPIPELKYRIQCVDFQTYLELVDCFPATKAADNVRLRAAKEVDRQYWKFEKVSSGYLVRNVANSNQCLYYDLANTNNSSVYSGQPDVSATGNSSVNVTYGDGAYWLAFCNSRSSTNYYLFPSGSNGKVNVMSVKNTLDAQKWQLVPVTIPPLKNYLLEAGTYRIRNLDGMSILTMPSDNVITKGVYVRSLRKNPYQIWAVNRQPSGTYAIQNVGNNLYLGCGTIIPSSGDALVGLQSPFNWDLQSIGGFAWSLRIPTADISVGFAEYEVDRGTEVRLAPLSSDAIFRKVWFMEKYIGGDQIHANRGVAEGRYILQNSSETTIYMNVFSAPYRITPGTMKTSQFDLKYIDEHSPLFTLTYVTKSTPPPIVADIGGYLGITLIGTQFVLLEQSEGDRGFFICRPDSGQVISGRVDTDVNRNDVFSVEENSHRLLQKWNFIPVTN